MGRMKKRTNRNKKKKKKKLSNTLTPTPSLTTITTTTTTDTSADKHKSRASQILTSEIRRRLHTRRKMMRTARLGGTPQQVQNVMNKFNNEGDDEKNQLLNEIKDDVKGMKGKAAKKYLKQVVSGMNTQQTDAFVDMVKDKMPSNQGGDIVNYVKRHRKVQEKKEANKPKLNPKTVYKPKALMTEEEKKLKTEQRQLERKEGETHPKKKKKKKGFSKIHIKIPKLTEIRHHPSVSSSNSNVGTSRATTQIPQYNNNNNKKQDIERLFQTQEKLPILSYAERMKNESTFSVFQINQESKISVFESVKEDENIYVKRVTVKKRFHPLICRWLESLTCTVVNWSWLVTTLNKFGVIQSRDRKNVFDKVIGSNNQGIMYDVLQIN